jgi:hypothetical protein
MLPLRQSSRSVKLSASLQIVTRLRMCDVFYPCISLKGIVHHHKENNIYRIFLILVTSVTALKMAAFWDAAPCTFVKVSQRFRDSYCLLTSEQSPWLGRLLWWRQKTPLKRQCKSSRLHGVISQIAACSYSPPLEPKISLVTALPTFWFRSCGRIDINRQSLYVNVSPILNSQNAAVFVPCSAVQFGKTVSLPWCPLWRVNANCDPRALRCLHQTAHSFEPYSVSKTCRWTASVRPRISGSKRLAELILAVCIRDIYTMVSYQTVHNDLDMTSVNIKKIL